MNGPMGLLNDLVDRLEHPAGVLERIGKDILLPSFQEEIFTAGHGTWPPLSPYTLIEKEELGFPLDPEIRTYALLESLTDGGPGNVLEVDAQAGTVTAGTSVEYARQQQEGDPAQRLPARPFVVITEDDRRDIMDALSQWVTGART